MRYKWHEPEEKNDENHTKKIFNNYVLIFLLLVAVAVIALAIYNFAHATQGCCSHHDGVCGCSGGHQLCCDGSLSPSCTCASQPKQTEPIFTPETTEYVAPVNTYTPTEVESQSPSPTPSDTPEQSSTPEQTATPDPTTTPEPVVTPEEKAKEVINFNKSYSYLLWGSVIALIVYIVYKSSKSK